MATAKTPDDAMNEFQRELKALRDDLAALASSVKTMATEQADAVGAKVRDGMHHLSDSMRMSADEARRRGEAVAAEVEEAIARHPLTAVGIAAGVGFLLGALMRR